MFPEWEVDWQCSLTAGIGGGPVCIIHVHESCMRA